MIILLFVFASWSVIWPIFPRVKRHCMNLKKNRALISLALIQSSFFMFSLPALADEKLGAAKKIEPTFKGLALNQIQIICLLQNATLETTAQSFQIPSVDVEQKFSHFRESSTISPPKLWNLSNFLSLNRYDYGSDGRQIVIWPKISWKIEKIRRLTYRLRVLSAR